MVFNKMLTVTTLDGNNYDFDDVGVQGAATTAYNQYMAHQTIHSYIEENGAYVEIFIPYSSIMDVFIEEAKNNSPIWDKNCSEGSCEGLYFFYAMGSSTFSPIEEGMVITTEEVAIGVGCAPSPELSDPSELLPISVSASTPGIVNIVPEPGINVCAIVPVSSGQTEIAISVPSQGCVFKFTVRVGQ